MAEQEKDLSVGDNNSDSESYEQFFVEKIVETRFGENGEEEFFIKWKGYPDDDNSWATREEMLSDQKEYLLAFEKRRQAEESKDKEIEKCSFSSPQQISSKVDNPKISSTQNLIPEAAAGQSLGPKPSTSKPLDPQASTSSGLSFSSPQQIPSKVDNPKISESRNLIPEATAGQSLSPKPSSSKPLDPQASTSSGLSSKSVAVAQNWPKENKKIDQIQELEIDILTWDEKQIVKIVRKSQNGETTVFENGREPGRITYAIKKFGECMYLMEWKDSTDIALVFAKDAHVICPQIVISFLQGLVTWAPPEDSAVKKGTE